MEQTRGSNLLRKRRAESSLRIEKNCVVRLAPGHAGGGRGTRGRQACERRLKAHMNLISHLFDVYAQWIASWQPRTTSLAVHAAMVLAIPTVVCLAAFRAGSRAVAIQALAAVTGALFVAGLQIDRRMPTSSVGLAWAVTLSAVLLVILPPVLAYLITPRRGTQRHLALLLYTALLGLLTANFFWKGAP